MVEKSSWKGNSGTVMMEQFMVEKLWWNSHYGTVMVEQLWGNSYGETVMGEQLWGNSHGGTVMVKK